MRKPFNTYASCGLISGALAALCFSLEARWHATYPNAYRPMCAMLLQSVGPALCIMLPAVWVRFSRQQLLRYVTAAPVAAFLIWFFPNLVRINYGGEPPPPWPDFTGHSNFYALAIFLCGYLATLYASGIKGQLERKAFNPVLACAAILVLGYILRFALPEENYVLQKWEYGTMLFGIPLYARILWAFRMESE